MLDRGKINHIGQMLKMHGSDLQEEAGDKKDSKVEEKAEPTKPNKKLNKKTLILAFLKKKKA